MRDLLALPLDLPVFQPDDWNTFWKIWMADARIYRRVKRDSAGNTNPYPGWHGFSWTFGHPDTTPMTMFDIVERDYSDVFPKWRASMEEAFPFRIHRMIFQSNYKQIGEHRDGMRLDRSPGLRIGR